MEQHLPNGGQLFVIATPIGNLMDITPRSIEILSRCNAIACEDTRNSIKLMRHLGIDKPLIAYHDHNEVPMAQTLADRIQSGEKIAIISDAGTPAISDPGFRVVRECRKRGLNVTPLPGPNAAIIALSISGLPSDGFLFLGFLQPKTAARVRTFTEFADFQYTLVLYESTYRVEKCLNDIKTVLGPERIVSVSRELTKLHEQSLTGTVDQVLETLKKSSFKGEFVICIARKGFTL
jgi:16S rRNA (cytidine1402-2'-O)-methyltransferase